MNDSWTNPIVENWKSLGIKLNSGLTLSEITKAERQIGIDFPDDFKELYTQMNGFVDGDWTPTMYSFWPLERILEEYGQWGTSEFVGICDYLINSHSLGFVKDKVGVFREFGTQQPELIAQSFSEVIHLINSGDSIIY